MSMFYKMNVLADIFYFAELDARQAAGNDYKCFGIKLLCSMEVLSAFG